MLKHIFISSLVVISRISHTMRYYFFYISFFDQRGPILRTTRLYLASQSYLQEFLS